MHRTVSDSATALTVTTATSTKRGKKVWDVGSITRNSAIADKPRDAFLQTAFAYVTVN